MGTSNIRLVKAGAQRAPQAVNPAPKQVRFTNWSKQFLAEFAEERASRPAPRVQFNNLFRVQQEEVQ